MKSLITVLFTAIVVLQISAQCIINDCPGGFSLNFDTPQAIGSSIQINNVDPVNFTCLLSDSFSVSTFGAGVDIYIFQLLPDGTRMSQCNVLNSYPNNVITKTEIVTSVGDFCGLLDFNTNITIDDTKGFIPCDGAVYEVVAAAWVDSLGLGTVTDPSMDPITVYDVWPNGTNIYFFDTTMAIVEFDITGDFDPGTPKTTAILSQWGTNATGTILVNCTDIDIYVEAMSLLANCPPFLDLTTGITSELENELYFTINNGPEIDVLTTLNPQGGILSGPDSLNNNQCYAGIFTESQPVTLPLAQFDLCEEDTVRVFLTTTDMFTGITESDQLNITFSPNGCNACPPPCNFSVSTTFDCNTEEMCVSAPGGSLISWGPDYEFGGNNPTSACTNVSPLLSTNYIVTVLDAGGCSATDVINVGYNGSVNAGNDVQIFDGDNYPIQATLPGATSFSWSPTTGLSNPNLANPNASPSTTTTYTVTAINANGCVSEDELTITVFPTNALVFNVGNEIEFCEEFESININANFFPFSTCVWTLPDGSQIADCILNLNSASLGTYTCEIVDTITMQTGIDSVAVIIDPVQVDAGDNFSACFGSIVDLDATTQDIVSYSWSPASALINPNSATPSYFANADQTFVVNAISVTGCASEDSLKVAIEQLAVDLGDDITICLGETVNLDATGVNIASYQWTGNVSNPSIANPTATPTSVTTYNVTVEDNFGCSASDDITIFVEPEIVLSISNSDTIELGQSNNLLVSSSDADATINWQPNLSLSCSTCFDPIATPTETTTYYVTVENEACSTMDSVTITIDIPESIIESSKNVELNWLDKNLLQVKSAIVLDQIEIINLEGKTIFSSGALSSTSIEIDSKHFLTGIYFMHIKVGNEMISEKFFVK